MEKTIRSAGLAFFAIALAFGLLLGCPVPQQAQAATVSKVSISFTGPDAQNIAQYKVQGKSKQGKTVWTYKAASKTGMAQFDPISAKLKGKYVYIIDGSNYDHEAGALFVKAKKDTGKIVLKKRIKELAGCVEMAFADNRIYVANVGSSELFKLTLNGGVIWKTIYSDAGGPYGLKISKDGKKLTVRYEWFEPSKETAVFSTSSGKFLYSK